MSEPIPWNYVFNNVKSMIPNAPDALIRQQVFKVMIDFTYSTNVWQEQVPFTTELNVYTYPVPVTTGRPARLMLVYDATDMPYIDPHGPPTEPPPRKYWIQGGIAMRPPGVIRLQAPPTEPKRLVAVISKQCGTLQMTDDEPPVPTGYPEIDAWVVDSYGDVISYGVMACLQGMPAKPFRDPQSSVANTAYYNSGKSEVRVNHMHGNVFGGQSWSFPQGFATTTRKGWT